MHEGINTQFEYTTGPVIGSTITMVVLGLSVNFVLFRPGWLVPSALVAGAVASLLSGYYQPSGNNALLGVLIGMTIISPVIAWARLSTLYGVTETWDLLFLATGLAGGWLLLVFVVILPMTYIAAWVVDQLRKRLGWPIGYQIERSPRN